MTPTQKTYTALNDAYKFFNEKLFEGKLPQCLITMQRKNKAFGYFGGGRFANREGENLTDEIALNPSHFGGRTAEQTLSTLVHEMVHLQQHHFGKKPRGGYHDRQWATMMRAVGLVPSDTGQPGGRETGQKVSHHIEEGGAFAVAMTDPTAPKDFFYVEQWSDADSKKRKAKSESKTKFTCPTCRINAWGKASIKLICGECNATLVCE